MNITRAEFLRRGFTLTELMIAVAIIAILAGFLAPSVSTYMRRSKGLSAAREVAGTLRWARNQAMSRGQVVLVDITEATGEDNGTIVVSRTQTAACNPADPGPNCYARSCAQANALPATGIIPIDSATLTMSDASPDMRISGIDATSTVAGVADSRLCFAPDGRVLNNLGLPFESKCTGVNARIFVQADDGSGFSNPLGGPNLNDCLDTATIIETDRQKQKNGRDIANFFVIQVPFNGAISVVQ
jgi:prepilin-type N-terminal cleavage/methylation domain-containing protein